MKPQTLATKPIYQGRIFNVTLDTIKDGELEYTREIVHHRGSAVILPLFEDNTVALVRQYRYAAGEYLLELPAGTLDPGEDPATAARRELEEEIGVTAARIELLTAFYVYPGFLTEKMYVYLATALTQTTQNLDEDEQLEIVRLPFEEALQLAKNGQIQDAKTIAGLMLAAQRV